MHIYVYALFTYNSSSNITCILILNRSELQHQSMLAHTRKKELRKELQTFETEFLARNKR